MDLGARMSLLPGLFAMIEAGEYPRSTKYLCLPSIFLTNTAVAKIAAFYHRRKTAAKWRPETKKN